MAFGHICYNCSKHQWEFWLNCYIILFSSFPKGFHSDLIMKEQKKVEKISTFWNRTNPWQFDKNLPEDSHSTGTMCRTFYWKDFYCVSFQILPAFFPKYDEESQRRVTHIQYQPVGISIAERLSLDVVLSTSDRKFTAGTVGRCGCKGKNRNYLKAHIKRPLFNIPGVLCNS